LTDLKIKAKDGSDLTDFITDNAEIKKSVDTAIANKVQYILINKNAIKAKLPDPASDMALSKQSIALEFPSPMPSPYTVPTAPPSINYGAKPTTVKFILTGKSSTEDITVEKEILLLPAFNESGQVYGQCTWLAGYMLKFAENESTDICHNIIATYRDTIQIDGNPESTAFPKKGSIIANGGHMAYVSDIVEVSATEIDSETDPHILKKYNLIITQANIPFHDGRPEYFLTTMEVKCYPDKNTYTITK